MSTNPRRRLAAIAAIDAYAASMYESPEYDTDTEAAIIDLITDLSYLVDSYRADETLSIPTWDRLLGRAQALRRAGA